MADKLISQGNYKPLGGDPMDSESETEQVGWLPPKVQIERMMVTGERLRAWKREYYDYEAGEKIPEDPGFVKVRDPNYDMADAHQDMLLLRRKMKLQERGASKKIEDDEKSLDKDLKEDDNEVEAPEEPVAEA